MARRCKNRKFVAQKSELIPLDYAFRCPFISCLFRPIYHCVRELLAEFFHAANVIVVVVGEQNRFGLPLVFLNCLKHRSRFARIDNHTVTLVIA